VIAFAAALQIFFAGSLGLIPLARNLGKHQLQPLGQCHQLPLFAGAGSALLEGGGELALVVGLPSTGEDSA
jgi:hypothetical protein